MNTDPNVITQEQIDLFVQQTHARYMVALFILLGMLCVALGSLAMAFDWRKTGFLFLAIYGGLMAFIGIGFCYIFGPIVLIASLGGIAREWIIAPSRSTIPPIAV